MLRRGGIGGSVGVWRGGGCPHRPSTTSSPDPCPRATSHTVMDYARVDAHPRSMLHWAAKTNHQPLKGRSLAKTYRRLNPTSISHRIVSSPTRTCVYVCRTCYRFSNFRSLDFLWNSKIAKTRPVITRSRLSNFLYATFHILECGDIDARQYHFISLF